MGYEFDKLQVWHTLAIDLHCQGLTNEAIGVELQRSSASISYVLNSPLAQDRIARRRKELVRQNDETIQQSVVRGRAILEGAAQKAAQTQVGLLESIDENIKLRTSQSILDRVYGKESSESKPTVHISVDVAELIKKALTESRAVKDTPLPPHILTKTKLVESKSLTEPVFDNGKFPSSQNDNSTLEPVGQTNIIG
jgi:hypothetical protein